MKSVPFQPAEALRRKYVADDPVRDLLADLRAGLEQATTDQEREALRTAAAEAADSLIENDDAEQTAYLALASRIDEAVDGPAPLRMWDEFYTDPDTQVKGRMVDADVLRAESEIFRKVEAAVAKAADAFEAHEIVAAAQQGDWTPYELMILGSLAPEDDGSIEAAQAQAEADANAEQAALVARMEAAQQPPPTASLDDEVARFAAEVSA